MPLKDSHEKGNLYIHLNVHIPSFNDNELNDLEDFFEKRGATK
jgi:hypothetical protein